MTALAVILPMETSMDTLLFIPPKHTRIHLHFIPYSFRSIHLQLDMNKFLFTFLRSHVKVKKYFARLFEFNNLADRYLCSVTCLVNCFALVLRV